VLDGHLGRLLLAVENVGAHLARHAANFVVVDRDRTEAARFGHAALTRNDGDLGGVGDLGEGGNGAGKHVVRRQPHALHLAVEAGSGLLDVVDVGDRGLEHLHAALFGGLLEDVDLVLGVDFAGVVDRADGLGVGDELEKKFELGLDRTEVGDARDVAAGLFVGLDKLGSDEVGDGGRNDRRALGGRGHSLGGGRRDGEDQLVLVGDEAGGDVVQIRLVALGVLEVDLDVDAVLVAAFGKRVLDTLGAGVEGGVFNELDDAHGHEFGLGGLLVAAARECQRGSDGKRDGAAARNLGNLHGVTPE